MTVMPLVAPATTPRAPTGTASASDGMLAAEFAALVDQALAGDAPASLTTPPLTTLPTAPSLIATTGSSSLPPVTGLPPVATDDEPEPATTDAPAPGSAGFVPVIGLPVPAVLPVVVDAPAPVAPATSSPTSGVRGADSPIPLPGVGPASSAEPSTPKDSTGPPSDSTAATTVTATSPTSPTSPTPSTSVAAAAPTPPVGTVTAPSTAPASPVTAQVFPEVTRLVSTGTGTHRVTLQLNPAALGEVRVTLTVRAGVVRVSLAASSEAQASLLHGAPELRRLLELTGASDTRIVVRDLPIGAAPVTAPPSASTDTGTGAFGQPGSGQVGHGGDRSQDQHAGTRDGASNARDGDHDEAARRRPIDPTTRTRTSGVDVTM